MAGTPGAAGPGAPFPQWTVVLGGSQRVGKVGNAVQKALVEASVWPAKVYFFTSEQAAQAFANAHGGSASIPGLNQAANAAQGATNAATGAAQDIAKGTFHLAFGNTSGLLVRILKVAGGLVLMILGAVRITGAGKTLITALPVVGGAAGRLVSA